MANKFLTSIKARYFGATSSTAIDIGVDGDDEPRVKIDAGGRITWGPGDIAGDVYVQRTAAGAVNFVGDVGVNTVTPAYELDVTGTVGANKVNFDLGTNELTADGDLAWDDLDQALAYRTNGLTVDIAQENVVYVRNPSGGSTITKGSVVAVLGADSNRLSVQLCDSTAGAGLGCRTVGVVMQDITSPGFGFVSTFGLLRGFNTGNIIGTAPVEAGAELFISSTPGVLSTDPQPSPGRRVTVGYVVTTGTQGSIFITIRRGLAVNELDNVAAPSPNDGDVLTYDNDAGVWSPASVNVPPSPLDVSYVSDNYTLQLSDAEGLIVITGASVGITVPNEFSVNFPIGTRVRVLLAEVVDVLTTDDDAALRDDDNSFSLIGILGSAAPTVQIIAAEGVTVASSTSLTVNDLWSYSTLLKYGVKDWVFLTGG
jgi:hypothetical protein